MSLPEECDKSEHQLFCEGLKAERERRGIALSDIAASTKVKMVVLSGLESNDLSRWPAGTVYRRAIVRDYASAVGLPLGPTVAEFDRLFPETPTGPLALPGVPPTDRAAVLRMALAAEASSRTESRPSDAPTTTLDLRTRLLASCLELGGVLLLAGGATLVARVPMWVGVSLLGLAYQAVSTLCVGQGFASWWLTTRASRARVAKRARVGGLLEPETAMPMAMVLDVPTPSRVEAEEPDQAGRAAEPGAWRRLEWGKRTQAWAIGAASFVSAARLRLNERLRQSLPAGGTLNWTPPRLDMTRFSEAWQRLLRYAKARVDAAPDLLSAALPVLQRHRERVLTSIVAVLALLAVMLYYTGRGDRQALGSASAAVEANAPHVAPHVAPSGQVPSARDTRPITTRPAAGGGSSPLAVSKTPPRLDNATQPGGTAAASARPAVRRSPRRVRAAAPRRSPAAASAPADAAVSPQTTGVASEQTPASAPDAAASGVATVAADASDAASVAAPPKAAPAKAAARRARRAKHKTPRPAQR